MRIRFVTRMAFTVLGTTFAACQPADGEVLARAGVLTDAPSIEGHFEMRIASMYDGSEHKSYHVRTADGTFELTSDDPQQIAAWDALGYQSFVRAYGSAVDPRTFATDELEMLAPPPEPLIDPSPRPYRRIATVLLHWNGAGEYSNEQAKDSMFIAGNSTNVFYGENSYGREKIAGDVFGSYEIEKPLDCYSDEIKEKGLAAFIEKGHDPNEFFQFMWYFPGGLGCAWGGLGVSGNVENPGKDSWYNGGFQCVVRAQEIGHNYGLAHSHAYNCVDEMGAATPLSDDCEHIEYGDPFDPMGGGCAHMNVVQKGFMGWIEGCNIVTTQSDGIYHLLPTELPCNGTQALRFPSYREDRHYYLEYRQPLGVDGANGVTGVLLHESNDFDYTPNVYILDVGTNGQMHEGDSYDDPQGVVSFTVLEEHDTHAVIQVTFPDGGTGSPTCHDGTEPEVVDGNIGSLECADEPYPLDTEPPTVTITYPADGDVFEPGDSFVVTIDAQDDRGITEAELYLDGKPLYKIWEPPYEWPVTELPMPESGDEYEFGVIVRDGPNRGLSEPITIQVHDLPDGTSTGAAADDTTDDGPSDESDEGEESGDEESSGGPAIDAAADGCGCRSNGGGSPWFLLLLPAALVRRRRT